MKHFLLSLVLCLLVPIPAAAQIYTWHDASGTLVLSNRPKTGPGEQATYAAPTGHAVRTAIPGATGTSRFDAIIDTHASAHGISPDLVRAVIQVESAFNPRAVSPKGALGLMQLMPATARELGVTDPFLPEQNIKAGVTYLKQLLNRYNQDITLALAAYNAGPGSVEKYGTVPPYKETRAYVKKITSAAPAPPPNAIYRWIEIVDGREVRRYSNKPPAGVAYEIVGRR